MATAIIGGAIALRRWRRIGDRLNHHLRNSNCPQASLGQRAEKPLRLNSLSEPGAAIATSR
jgi:hypothetical protein